MALFASLICPLSACLRAARGSEGKAQTDALWHFKKETSRLHTENPCSTVQWRLCFSRFSWNWIRTYRLHFSLPIPLLPMRSPPLLLGTSPSLSAKRMSTGSWERFGLRSFNQILEVSLQMSGYSWFFPAAPILAGWCADEGGGIPSHHRQARPRAHAHGFLRDSWKSAPLPQVPHPTQKDWTPRKALLTS